MLLVRHNDTFANNHICFFVHLDACKHLLIWCDLLKWYNSMVTINAQFDVITTISNMLQYFVKSSLFYTLRLVCLQYFDPSLYSIPFLISFAYFMWGIILSANCLPHLHPSLKQISDFRLLCCSVRMCMISSYVTRRIHCILQYIEDGYSTFICMVNCYSIGLSCWAYR